MGEVEAARNVDVDPVFTGPEGDSGGGVYEEEDLQV